MELKDKNNIITMDNKEKQRKEIINYYLENNSNYLQIIINKYPLLFLKF